LRCFKPAAEAAETALELSPEQRKRTVWRMDGGSGADDELRWLLAKGYHVMAKGISNRRAEALAAKVSRWDPYQENSWLGEVESPIDYGRPVRVFVKRRSEREYLHSYYITLSFVSKNCFHLYDDRWRRSRQFRSDKSGLRWKPGVSMFLGQKVRPFDRPGSTARRFLSSGAGRTVATAQNGLCEIGWPPWKAGFRWQLSVRRSC
jgi:hypothetical protein